MRDLSREANDAAFAKTLSGRLRTVPGQDEGSSDNEYSDDDDDSSTDDEPSRDFRASAISAASNYPHASLTSASSVIKDIAMAVLTQRVTAQFDSPLACFLAYSSVDTRYKSFRKAGHITQLYSAVVYTFQLVLLYEFSTDDALLDENKLTAEVTPLLSRIMREHFTVQSESALGDVLSLRAYGFAIKSQTSATGNEVAVLPDHQFALRNTTLDLTDFKRYLQDQLTDLGLRLTNTLLLKFQNYKKIASMLKLEDIAKLENSNDWSLGFSIINAHKDAEYFRNFLLTYVLLNARDEWFEKIESDGEQRILMRKDRAVKYMTAVSEFLERLLVMVHICSGAPARGTEINTVLYSNTLLTRRNLYIDPMTRLLTIKLRYSKTFSVTGDERTAIRVLPMCLTEILVSYIAVVKPFTDSVFLEINRRQLKKPNMLFFDPSKDRQISSKRLARILRLDTKKLLANEITISKWRHLATAMIRSDLGTCLPPDMEHDDRDGAELVAAIQMHHSVRTALLNYGRSRATYANTGYALQEKSIAFSKRWHKYLGVDAEHFDLLSVIYPSMVRNTFT